VVQSVETERPPPTTWPEYFRDVASRVAIRGRTLLPGAGGEALWVRPALVVIAAVSAWSYAWRADRPVNIEIYYAAAARSMTAGMSNFFFGAFDPAGTVSIDKLPGAFWLQAISVGIFGPHPWALVLPQVIEGTLTVFVLYHAVRQVAGPKAGLAAAGLLAISAATIALNRGNISDTLMILLAVLAADSVITAVRTGRRRPLLLTGVWVGLAFQAKMLEAWLVLPALAACYLIAADGGWLKRLRRCAAMTTLAVVISLSWMSLVTVWPSADRPYIDGSTDNSAFQQVFVYNGFGRLDQSTPDQLLSRTLKVGIPVAPPPSSWNRLLTGELGRDVAWLLPAAIIALVAGIAARRREPRTDLIRAGLVLWGLWLIVLFVAFSAATTINTYYTAALSPAIAGLLAIGLTLAWQRRARLRTWLTIGVAVLATAGYGAWLLPGSGTGLPGWLRPALIGIGAAAVCILAAVCWQHRAPARTTPGTAPAGPGHGPAGPGQGPAGPRQAPAGPRQAPAGTGPVLAAAAIGVAAACVLIVPAVAASSVVTSGLGPFQTPFESARVTAGITRFQTAPFEIGPSLAALEHGQVAETDLMATQTAALAAAFIWASGREVLPIGGFTGTIPEPTLGTIQNLIRTSVVRTFIQSPTTTDPRLVWVARHCRAIKARSGPKSTLPIAVYFCLQGI
jgi:4-amino-4-deoxy-L-arabinose transferase-like glycosyltransferase